MQSRDEYPRKDPHRPGANIAIISFAIACCALTMVIVVAVAIAANG